MPCDWWTHLTGTSTLFGAPSFPGWRTVEFSAALLWVVWPPPKMDPARTNTAFPDLFWSWTLSTEPVSLMPRSFRTSYIVVYSLSGAFILTIGTTTASVSSEYFQGSPSLKPHRPSATSSRNVCRSFGITISSVAVFGMVSPEKAFPSMLIYPCIYLYIYIIYKCFPKGFIGKDDSHRTPSRGRRQGPALPGTRSNIRACSGATPYRHSPCMSSSGEQMRPEASEALAWCPHRSGEGGYIKDTCPCASVSYTQNRTTRKHLTVEHISCLPVSMEQRRGR